MTAFCHPLPRTAVEEMLQFAARAMCDRPGDTSPQRNSRTHQMVLATLGLAPRDGLEFMLATLAFGHFQLLLDSMSDVFHGQADALKAKTKTSIVPLGRAMLEMIRELRRVQLRPTAEPAEDAKPQATAEEQPLQAAAPAACDEPPADLNTLSEAELTTLTDPRLGLPEEVLAWLAGAAPSAPEPMPPEPAMHGPAAIPPAPASPDDLTDAFNVFAQRRAPSPAGGDADLPAWQDDSKSVEERILSYHETLAAAYETVAQQRAQHAAGATAV